MSSKPSQDQSVRVISSGAVILHMPSLASAFQRSLLDACAIFAQDEARIAVWNDHMNLQGGSIATSTARLCRKSNPACGLTAGRWATARH